MHTISIPDAQLAVKHVCVAMNEPLFFWGQPGVGKSEAIAQVTEEIGGVLCDIRLSQYDSVDLRGLPDRDNNQTVWHAPSTMPFVGNPAFPTDRTIILFFDEANAAAQSVAAVAYQIVNDQRCGEHLLLPNVRIVAAGNREGDKGVTNKMPLPLANRFTHYEIGLDVDAWCIWAQSRLPAIGVAFMQFRKPLLSTFDPSKPDKAFATPRTWAKALRYYDAAMPAHIKQASMAGAVGDGPAGEFWGFVDVWQQVGPMMQEIRRRPKTAPLPEEAAMNYAVAVAISGEMDAQTMAGMHLYLTRMDPEFVVLAWSLALQRDPNLDRVPEFLDFSKQYRAVFR